MEWGRNCGSLRSLLLKGPIRGRVQNTVIRLLKEPIRYFNSIKKTQAKMKVTLSEIKKNLQGISSGVDEAKNQ